MRKGDNDLIDGSSVGNILSQSHFVIIQGTGGIGKSTFLKHLFINEIDKEDLIPVFIELKDLNAINNDDYDISDFVFQRLYDLGSTLKKEYMEYALRSGCFLFLLDGYDEIFTDKKDVFFRKLDSFCDRYSENYFIISSRPYSEFVEFQRFSVLKLASLNKNQALELVKKVDFDQEIKQRFLTALDERLYDNHTSFASNPLLLSIMLLTFDNYAEIPEKLHLFYANAFETLYSKHDATKAGYRRELRCSLSFDYFKKAFACFCFLTYYQGKFELTYDEINTVLKKISPHIPPFEPADFLFDLINSVCVLYKDGLTYKFTHRSFQEYFTAVFLKELPDKNMKKMGTELAQKDLFRLSHDSVFSMLYDMVEQRFEQNILLPLIIKFEDTCVNLEKYDFYFNAISPSIRFVDAHESTRLDLCVSRKQEVGMVKFLFEMAGHYIDGTTELKNYLEDSKEKLFHYLQSNFNYKINNFFFCMDYPDDKELYALMRETWIGLNIQTLSNLKSLLEKKCRDEEMDLDALLME
ncbi:putative uncharacterized protein [Clostridium sp. CAG:505]|nr:putative uncharacterized protein [Clostridium sp. CAG:505]